MESVQDLELEASNENGFHQIKVKPTRNYTQCGSQNGKVTRMTLGNENGESVSSLLFNGGRAQGKIKRNSVPSVFRPAQQTFRPLLHNLIS